MYLFREFDRNSQDPRLAISSRQGFHVTLLTTVGFAQENHPMLCLLLHVLDFSKTHRRLLSGTPTNGRLRSSWPPTSGSCQPATLHPFPRPLRYRDQLVVCAHKRLSTERAIPSVVWPPWVVPLQSALKFQNPQSRIEFCPIAGPT